MRRLPSRLSGMPSLLVGAAVAAVAALGVLGPATLASAAAPSPAGTTSPEVTEEEGNPKLGPATPGEEVCAVTATALNNISGMVATDQGLVVVEGEDTVALRTYTLDDTCKATAKTFSAANPLSPQDMAVGSDGTIWIADIGDKDGTRTSVAVWKIPPGDPAEATIYRMTYPDGKHDAAAMLLDKDDTPLIITRSSTGGAGSGIYRPTKALVPETRTNLPALEKVGEFTPERTGTANPLALPGQSIVTGAAKAPDGSKVVIRTYADAYEFDVTDGDVVAAITSENYRITPLPDEPQGEAITYSVDGASFLTLGLTSAPKLLKYTPFVPPPPAEGDPSDNLPDAPGGQSWLDKLTFSDLTRIVAAVGVVGLVLAIAGIVGIRRARRRRREEEEYDYDDYDEPRRRHGRRGDDFSGLRGGRYDDPYADSSYGSGYPGYGADPYGGQYAGQGYGQEGHGQYAGQGGYGGGYGQEYGGQYYGDQGGGQGGSYAGDQYGGGQEYGGQYAGGGQYGGGQAYPGYGYEEDFDPTHDPRRR